MVRRERETSERKMRGEGVKRRVSTKQRERERERKREREREEGSGEDEG